jgi:hypothetical protein
MHAHHTLAAAILFAAVPLSLSASAATFIVDSAGDAADAVPGDGICATAAAQCTLRAAVQEADALGGANTISVPAGTYSVATPLFSTNATNALTITGTGAPLTTIIDGGLVTGIFNLQQGTTNLDNVVIQNGSIPITTPGAFGVCTGAGIFVSTPAIVNVNASRIADNQTMNGSGGGLCVLGTATLTDTTVADNSATFGGGGMRVQLPPAAATIVDSTFSGNSIAGSGAAGAAIESQSVLTITQSTISGNTVGAGGSGAALAIVSGATTTSIRNSTIAANTGGSQIDVFSGSATFASTIVAYPSGGSNCATGAPGSIVSGGNNLDSTATCNFVAATDIVDADPLLGPLANNGGPTQTRALLASSPAIDQGANPLGLSTDQRGSGFPRVVGAAPDIGAFETTAAAGVAPAITSGPPGNGIVGVPYAFTYTSTGSPAPTFALTAGALPSGLTLSSAGVISGTPTTAGVFTGRVTASNGVPPDATQDFSITIAAAPATVPTQPIPALGPWLLALLSALVAWIGARRR